MQSEKLYMIDGTIILLSPTDKSKVAYEKEYTFYSYWDITVYTKDRNKEKLNNSSITIPYSNLLYGIIVE